MIPEVKKVVKLTACSILAIACLALLGSGCLDVQETSGRRLSNETDRQNETAPPNETEPHNGFDRKETKTDSKQKESRKQRNNEIDTIHEVLGVETLMPFYSVFIAAPMKIAITILAVGLDKADKEKGIVAKGLLLLTGFFVIVATISDFKEAYKVIISSSLTAWEKVNINMLIVSTSSNVTLALLGQTSTLLYSTTKRRQIHNLPLSDEHELQRKDPDA